MKSPTRSPSELTFGSLLVYSPQGTAAQSVRSRQVARLIKNCRGPYIERVGLRFAELVADGMFQDLLGPGVTLVPAPRSSPTPPTVKGFLWPALRVCRELRDRGLCDDVDRLLERRTAVTKSALASKGTERPSPAQHLASLQCSETLSPASDRITIVDDIVTRGSTLLGCAWALAERFPDSRIRALAVVRTMSGHEVEDILSPVDTGRIYLRGEVPRREP